MIGLTILGATGSIGVSTLDVIARHPEKYRAVALTAHRNVEQLFQQCLQHKPDYAVMVLQENAKELKQKLQQANCKTEVLSGSQALEEVAALDSVEYVMAAIVGAAGLLPSLSAARAGKRVLLANKEALVMSGPLFMDAIRDCNAELLPIDSEHNAIFQCMPPEYFQGLQKCGVSKILLTASGGPFRDKEIAELHQVTPDQACAHPNWDMGRKISVDSATMMNKGLELIEACWLFNTEPEHIQVVIHPQSVIHSMVQYTDGSVLAQLGNPDMRTPIAHAMSWPERMESGVESLDLFAIAQLDFQAPDTQRFPCLRLAAEAMQAGGIMTTVLNAANEIAVADFLAERIRFTAIAEVVEECMSQIDNRPVTSITDILDVDTEAREIASSIIAKRGV